MLLSLFPLLLATPVVKVATALTARLSDGSRATTAGVPTLPCHTELTAADIVEVHPDPFTRVSCNTASSLSNDKVHHPFCSGFRAPSNTTTELPSPFVEVELKAPYVVRGFEFDPVFAAEP
ncbi:hypothetical protein FOZ63_021298, partial [Perkinsus olseni]